MSRLSQQVMQRVCRDGWREAIMPNVRDAVAVGIGTADLRVMNEIRAETVRRAKARSFAEQDQ